MITEGSFTRGVCVCACKCVTIHLVVSERKGLAGSVGGKKTKQGFEPTLCSPTFVKKNLKKIKTINDFGLLVTMNQGRVWIWH